jgi:putative endonuclease
MKDLNQRSQLGKTGEDYVADYLHNASYTLLARNLSWRGGEIDIVAQHKKTIVFVEVKTRRICSLSLAEMVGITKQRKIIRTAQKYLSENNLYHHSVRFDVALVSLGSEGFTVNYIENAFTAPESTTYYT